MRIVQEPSPRDFGDTALRLQPPLTHGCSVPSTKSTRRSPVLKTESFSHKTGIFYASTLLAYRMQELPTAKKTHEALEISSPA